MIMVLVQTSCKKDEFDYDDYESRVEYFNNISNEGFLGDSTLAIVTWNIKLAFPEGLDPWSDDMGGTPEHIDSLVSHLLAADPDIVFLQEVPLDRENTIIKKVLDSIAHRMGYNYAFGGHGFNSNGTYPTRAQWGNATLSKYKITEIENREVINLNDKWSRRSVLRTRIQLSESYEVDTYCLHYLSGVNSQQEFNSQIHKTVDFLNESSMDKIMGGDFNASRSIDPLIPLIDCLPIGEDVIDRIYVSETFMIQDYQYSLPGGLDFSDHRSYKVLVKLP